MKNLPGKSLLFALLFAFLGTGTGLASTSKQWEFKVYLDDSEIGFHRFTVREQTGRQHVISEAHFDVDFLFFNAYRYRHYNYEVWDDNCLISIQARTDDNGEEAYVIGEIAEDTLQVKSSGTEITLPGCIRSFAYWNPAALLEATRLLNSQTGDYQPVSIQNLPV